MVNDTMIHDLRVIFQRFEREGAAASAVVIRDAMRELGNAPQSAVPQVLLSQGWLDVGHERKRQVDGEGWTAEHDDEHSRGELAMAGAYYAVSHLTRPDGRCLYEALLWPWSKDWLKRRGRRHDLVRAAALIVAEIDRLDRQAARELEAQAGRLA